MDELVCARAAAPRVGAARPPSEDATVPEPLIRSAPGRMGGMSMRFEELAWRETPMGEISLRRRLDPILKTQVYEVKLGDEFLMSSFFTVAEVELARLGLAEL